MSGLTREEAATIGKTLQQPQDRQKRLPPLPAKGGIPGQTGKAVAPASSKASAGSGIDSPLTEQSREYYPTTTAVTTDGLLQVAYQPIKSVTFKDASKREVVLNYANPAG
ncbi:hypothetical protein [uncultured Aquitalea sp.]|uniref:hypothetical protein n=1 Tax=uncultured Aquitalea sp. TaxID=540272 RepID=UPI0025E05DC2|nr:hypothetical protein [uncultured Aquitalea sp.]